MDGILQTAKDVTLLTSSQVINLVIVGILLVFLLSAWAAFRRSTSDGTIDIKNTETIQTATVQAVKREDRHTAIIEDMVRQNGRMIEVQGVSNEQNRVTQEHHRKTADSTQAALTEAMAQMTQTLIALSVAGEGIGKDVKETLAVTRQTQAMLQKHSDSSEALTGRVGKVEERTLDLENRVSQIVKENPNA